MIWASLALGCYVGILIYDVVTSFWLKSVLREELHQLVSRDRGHKHKLKF